MFSFTDHKGQKDVSYPWTEPYKTRQQIDTKFKIQQVYFGYIISGFRRGVNEVFALLVCYAVQMGSQIRTFLL